MIMHRKVVTLYKKPSSSGNWWLSGGIAAVNCIGAYQAKGVASYIASKVNLARPGTYDLLEGTAYPTWSAADGWIWNSSSIYMRLYAEIGTYNNQDVTVICRYLPITDNSNGTLFTSISGGNLIIQPLVSGTNIIYYNINNVQITPVASGDTVSAIAGFNVYRNGNDEGDIASGTSTFTGINIGNRTVGSRSFPGNIYALAIYNTVLSTTHISALTVAMKAL